MALAQISIEDESRRISASLFLSSEENRRVHLGDFQLTRILERPSAL
jgi:hypothetical protein